MWSGGTGIERNWADAMVSGELETEKLEQNAVV